MAVRAVSALLVVSLACASGRPLLVEELAQSRALLSSSGYSGSRGYIDVPGEYKCHGHEVGKEKGVTSLDQCKAKCDDNPECFSVTWNDDDEICYLKVACNSYSEKDDNLSTVVPVARFIEMPAGYNCKVDGGNMGYATGVRSLNDCMDECNLRAGCTAVTWNEDDDKCFFKDSCDEFEEKDDNYSAVASGSVFVDVPEGYGCVATDGNVETIKGVSDFDSCKDKCDANSRCAAVTYNSESSKCYLKPSCDEYEAKDDNYSAVKNPSELVKLPNNFNCHGGNINDDPIRDVGSMGDCMDLCDGDDECFAVSYNKDADKCYLKTKCDNIQEKDRFRSAVKN